MRTKEGSAAPSAPPLVDTCLTGADRGNVSVVVGYRGTAVLYDAVRMRRRTKRPRRRPMYQPANAELSARGSYAGRYKVKLPANGILGAKDTVS